MPGEIDHGEGKMPGSQLLSLLGRHTDRQAVKKGTHSLYHAAVLREEGAAFIHFHLFHILHTCAVAVGFVKVQLWSLALEAPGLLRRPDPELRKHSIVPDMSGGGCPPGCRTPRGMGLPPGLRAASFRSFAWLDLRVGRFCFFVKHFFLQKHVCISSQSEMRPPDAVIKC